LSKKTSESIDFNAEKHVLAPKHKLLSKAEVEALLNKLNISLLQLPVITIKDPVAVALKLKDREVVRIERQGVTGSYNYFRRVVE